MVDNKTEFLPLTPSQTEAPSVVPVPVAEQPSISAEIESLEKSQEANASNDGVAIVASQENKEDNVTITNQASAQAVISIGYSPDKGTRAAMIVVEKSLRKPVLEGV